MIEVQDIFRAHGDEFLGRYPLNAVQMKAYHAILNCRTAALGGHVEVCDHCGYQQISYNSCRNRHCPKCQTLAKEQWIEKQEQSLLGIGYFHVVFTVPDDLNPIFRQNQATMYNLMFRAASETLLELSRDKRFLGAKPGITAILHTWGQNLMFHPHIHCIVTGGGLTDAGQWRNTRKKFFIPVKVLSAKFRGKFLAYMRKADLRFGGAVEDLNNPQAFDAFISGLYKKNWITYCKPPFKDASKVIQYLGRYTHRVAISNNRILKLENGMVTFNWRDYSDGNKVKEMTVTAVEFIRRFMLHILPSGFCKIRHYGILAPKGKSNRIALCRKLTNTTFAQTAKPRGAFEILKDKLGDKFNLCPRCGVGHMTRASPVPPQRTV